MSGSNYSVTCDDDCTILSARVKGRFIPLVSSTDGLKVKCIHRNILTGEYKNVRELCEDIYNSFKSQATLLVLVTLFSATPLSTKHKS